MNNLGFFTSKEIYARLVSSYRIKMAEFSEVEIMRWCSEVITDYLRDPTGMINNNKIRIGFGNDKIVKNNKVPVPDFMIKLEAVYDEKKSLIKDYSYQGGYIYFPSNNCPQEVYISYTTLAVDETGFPLIKDGYQSACYAYCVYKLFEEDASLIPPKIQQWRWREIVQDKDWEIEAASRSWEDINMNDVQTIHNYLLSPEYSMIVYGRNNFDQVNKNNSNIE